MTKPKSKFASLPEQDRNLIRELCSSRSYDQVVDLLAKPHAEGGLSISTSRSALCRFFTTTFSDSETSVLCQLAAAANIRHELASNAFLGAIRASVQARVFEMLKNGKALSDMEKDFKLLKTAESLYLADARFRATDPNAARPAYQALVDHALNESDFDFTPIDPLSSESVASQPQLSEFDQDVLKAREEQKPNITQHANLAPHPTLEPAKSPVIPHIPPNSTSRTPTVVPMTRTTPKIGRNDACPCGSGRKFKKCCERLGS